MGDPEFTVASELAHSLGLVVGGLQATQTLFKRWSCPDPVLEPVVFSGS